MRLLLDANLSPRVVNILAEHGIEASHLADVLPLDASDDQILELAARDGTVLVTADGDFGMLLAVRRADGPSMIHLRNVNDLTPAEHAALLAANLPAIQAEITGAITVSLSPARMAIRRLPLR